MDSMDEITFYLSLVTLILILIYYTKLWDDRGLPPGPWGLPFLGSVPFMGKKPYKKFLELSQKYGAIFSLRMGQRTVVVLNDYKAITEAFVKKGDLFNHRGEGTIMRTAQKGKGIIDAEGELWKEHRRFTLMVLRDFGFGKKTIEDVILRETTELLEKIESFGEAPLVLYYDLYKTIGNTVWSLVAGSRFDWNDPRLEELLNALGVILQGSGRSSILMALPWLRFVFNIGNKSIKEKRERRNAFFRVVLEEHKKIREDGEEEEASDLIHRYLKEATNQTSNQGTTTFDDEQIQTVMSDLFIAGMETVVATLRWSLLLMMKYPEIQRKIQEEIDDVIGRERLPRYEDRNKMSFTEAALCEIQRYAGVIPFVLHANPTDAELYGYRIPKRTWVFGNLWGVHHDPKAWDKPEEFNPYRFLNEDGSVKKIDAFMPFSVGRRSCLGESLARMEIFIVFVSILQKFTVSPPDGQSLDVDTTLGITVSPEQYELTVKSRLTQKE